MLSTKDCLIELLAMTEALASRWLYGVLGLGISECEWRRWQPERSSSGHCESPAPCVIAWVVVYPEQEPWTATVQASNNDVLAVAD